MELAASWEGEFFTIPFYTLMVLVCSSFFCSITIFIQGLDAAGRMAYI